MRLVTIQEVEKHVVDLGAKICASQHQLPTFGYSQDGARPHIEVDSSGIHYVVIERGVEFERVSSFDLDEVLWHVFEAVTFSLACDYELAHRREDQDCRRQIFARQLDLLAALHPEWARRQALHQRTILEAHPFDDDHS